eukprot:CAMPEP_0184691656 /NCGR_PEP_ID=MMETSP0313-20130426/436_1 /TAXON_ID=2792 /ORGANISM="Porphyridium aerugineum, Strain SAG 1380-2" /LENGTH=505 /DNA_ID=CAMNT_0027149409 /DNA_START=87 /DNA_END=1604 /DNA_ORIENTATION=+
MSTAATTSPAPPSGAPKQGGPQVGPYIFGKTLGTGSTGKVKLAKHVETGQLVAIKIIRKDFLAKKPSLRKKLLREIAVMKLCDHPNVLKLYDVFEIETHLFLVIEFVDGCELFDFLVKRGSLDQDQALNFFQQIVCGLEYCHRRLICHRDLKPENLLLDRNLNVKICDFGMTNLNPPGQFLETSCGSPHYAAPEVVSGDMYNGLEADIWSTGVILYAMVTGRLPFDDDNIQRLLNKVQRGVYHLPNDIDPNCRDLIKQMLNVDPSKRISIDGIKAHPWYTSKPLLNPYVDDFVAPKEPISNINSEVVRGLVDLGWGDVESVMSDLQTEGQSLEKVFYIQLEKHPMFHRKKDAEAAGGAAPAASNAPGPSEAEKKAAAERAEKRRAAWASIYDSAKKDGAAAPAAAQAPAAGQAAAAAAEEKKEPEKISPEEAAARAMEKLNMMSNTGRVSAANVKRSPSQLVRQSDLVKPADGAAVDTSDPSDTRGEKSWFSNFSKIFNNESPVV